MAEKMDSLTRKIQGLAEVLARLAPEDAGTQERYEKHWEAANLFAAERVVNENLRDKPVYSGWKGHLIRHLATEGLRIRNEYLAKVG